MATLLDTTSQEELKFLVLAAQEGDREAFGELVVRFEASVYRTAFKRMGNEAEAQELCQEVFLQAMRKLHQLREPEAFGGWLKSMTTRMGINRLTRKAPESVAEPHTLEGCSHRVDDPLANAIQGERKARLHAGLRRLRSLDRETLKAFYLDGCSLAEMAIHFDSPIGTIKRRLHMARKRLAAEIEDG